MNDEKIGVTDAENISNVILKNDENTYNIERSDDCNQEKKDHSINEHSIISIANSNVIFNKCLQSFMSAQKQKCFIQKNIKVFSKFVSDCFSRPRIDKDISEAQYFAIPDKIDWSIDYDSYHLTHLINSHEFLKKKQKCFDAMASLLELKDYQVTVEEFSDIQESFYLVIGLNYLLPELNCIDSRKRALKILYLVSQSYNFVAYHNLKHANYVTNIAIQLSKMIGFWDCLESIEKEAFIYACIGHDISHPGLNNNFMNRTSNPLTDIYSSLSVLENFHSATLLRLLKECCWPGVDNLNMRRMIVKMILATDIDKHFDILNDIKTSLANLLNFNQLKSINTVIQISSLILKISDLSYFFDLNPFEMLDWISSYYYEVFNLRELEIELDLLPSEPYNVDYLNNPKFFEMNATFASVVLFPMVKILSSFEHKIKKLKNSQNNITNCSYSINNFLKIKEIEDYIKRSMQFDSSINFAKIDYFVENYDEKKLLKPIKSCSLKEQNYSSSLMYSSTFHKLLNFSFASEKSCKNRNLSLSSKYKNLKTYNLIYLPLIKNINNLRKAKYFLDSSVSLDQEAA